MPLRVLVAAPTLQRSCRWSQSSAQGPRSGMPQPQVGGVLLLLSQGKSLPPGRERHQCPGRNTIRGPSQEGAPGGHLHSCTCG